MKKLKVPNETEIILAGGGGGALKGMLDVTKCYGVENRVLISLNENFTRNQFLCSVRSTVSVSD